MVNYLNICLKLPNIGLVTFYLVFVLLIPMLIFNFGEVSFLKYYLPILVAFANTLTLSGSPYIFQNLYSLQPKNMISSLSTLTINIIALSGIIWQITEYSKYEYSVNKDPIITMFYGLVLMGITFLISTKGLKLYLEQIDKWSNRADSRNKESRTNWHRLFFGLIFIILIIGLEVLLLGLLNGMNPGMNSQSNSNANSNNANNNANNNARTSSSAKSNSIFSNPFSRA